MAANHAGFNGYSIGHPIWNYELASWIRWIIFATAKDRDLTNCATVWYLVNLVSRLYQNMYKHVRLFYYVLLRCTVCILLNLSDPASRRSIAKSPWRSRLGRDMPKELTSRCVSWSRFCNGTSVPSTWWLVIVGVYNHHIQLEVVSYKLVILGVQRSIS